METVPVTDILLLFNYGHVYHHALESHPALPSQEKDEDDDVYNSLGHMTDKPFSAGCKYVNLGFVHDVTDMKSDNHYFVRAHVWLSM